MSQDAIVAKLIESRDDEAAEHYLRHVQKELSIDTVLALRKKAGALVANDPQLALMVSDRAAQASRFVDDPMAPIHALFARSNALLALAKYDELSAVSEEILAQAQPIKAWRQVAGAYRMKMLPLSVAGRMDEALDAGRLAKEACAKGGRSCDDRLAIIALSMAGTYGHLGDFEKAFEVALEAYEDASELPVNLEISLLGMIGQSLYELDRYDESEQYLQQAYALAQSGNLIRHQGLALFHIGKLYKRLGKYLPALDYFEKAKVIHVQLGLNANDRQIDAARASSYLELNLLDETLSILTSGLDAILGEDQHIMRCELLYLQGSALRRAERYDDAIAVLTKARTLAETVQREHILGLIQHELAYAFFLSGALVDARATLTAVQTDAELPNSPLLHAKLLVLSARCWLAQGDMVSAETDLKAASTLDARYTLPSIHIQILYLRGKLHEQQQAPEAYEQFEQSVTKIVQQTANLSVDELRIGYLSDKMAVFAAFINAAHQRVVNARMSLGKLLDALDLMLTAPLSNLAIAGPGHLSQADQERLHSLRDQWNWYQTKLDQVGFSSAFRGAAEPVQVDLGTYDKLQTIEIEIAELMRRQRIRASNSGIGDSGSLPSGSAGENAPDLHQSMQDRLTDEQAMVHFYKAQGHCQALVVTKNKIELLPNLIEVAALTQLMQTWRFHIQSVVPMQAEPLVQLSQMYLSKLYDGLFRPLLPILEDCQHLLLVLPAEWHDLPVPALYDGQHYLVEQFQISHLSTPQSLLYEHDAAPSDAERRALVVGYSDEGRLPNTLEESYAICQELPAYWQATHVIEADATAAHFRQHCQEAALVHLATHAVFRADNPLFSWIRFADKRVSVLEMYDMQLKQRPLVVLSACETGMGKAQGGGVLGMGRGLMAAGASQVVLSRWQLEDAASAELMRHFYQHYDAEKGNAAHALQQAQKATLLKHPHPFLWASYMHIQA